MSFDELYTRYHDELLYTVYRRILDWQLAEDVVQEAFGALIPQHYQEWTEEHIRRWLYKALVNKERQCTWRGGNWGPEWAPLVSTTVRTTSGEEVERRFPIDWYPDQGARLPEHVKQLVDRLGFSEEDLEIVTDRVAGVSAAQIADRLESTPGKIEGRYSKIVIALRRELGLLQ